MPSVKKENQKLVVEKVSTEHGEITVNLNLNIQLEGGNIQIKADAVPPQKEVEKKPQENPDFFPEEQFDLEIPVVSFGKDIKK